MIDMIKLIIEVDHGMVTHVYSDEKNVEVSVIDRDCQDNDSLKQTNKLYQEIQNNNYKIVY